jgi:hypothetical protein
MGDSDSISFAYEIENLNPPKSTSTPEIGEGTVKVNISRTLRTVWGLDHVGLEKVLGSYAKDHLVSKVESSSDSDLEEIQLSTYNAPNNPPFDPSQLNHIVPSEFEVDVPDLGNVPNTKSIEIASQIIDLRDTINAIYGERYKTRILSLPQERALFELSRRCDSREEFTHRMASLCALAVSIDDNAFDKVEDFDTSGKSVDKMGRFLRAKFSGDLPEKIMMDLQSFNQLRRMYPIHTDRSSGVLKAHQYFGINYPIEDYQLAWNSILESYCTMLQRLLKLIRGA